MWRLRPLSSSVKLSSVLPAKCQTPLTPIVRQDGTSLSQKQLVRNLWNGTKNYQAASPSAKLKTDNVFREGQEIEGFTVTEVSTNNHLIWFELFYLKPIVLSVYLCSIKKFLLNTGG